MIFFNHLPKTGGLFFLKNYIEPNFENIILHFKDINLLLYKNYNEQLSKINIKLNHDTFIHYHDWLPEKFDFKKIIKNINIKFSFCFIRNPIDIFYSSFYWCKDESIITSFLFKTIDSTTDINIDINDVNNPHDLIDYLDNHQKEIVLNEFFINKIFQNNNFNEYNIIFDYKNYISNINFITNQFKWISMSNVQNYKEISPSYGKSKNIDKSYKIEFLKKFLEPSIEVYTSLQNKIYKP